MTAGVSAASPRRVLLTGATGYVGGRLAERINSSGVQLRCLTRRPAALRSRLPLEIEVVAGDVLDAASLAPAMAGVEVAYYLVHSMGAQGDYHEKDLAAARNFGTAALAAGARRIVYLGGLATAADGLSMHLRSRQETGHALREAGVPVIELQASVIIGSGSLSFELIRALVERLPVMICPRWVSTLAQPIAIDDVLAYLVAAMDLPGDASQVFEIGGADQASYGDIMREYARQRGLTRRMVSVPFLTPPLSSLWLGLVTPVYARVGRELVQGLKSRSVVTDTAARRAFAITPVGLRRAIGDAIRNEDHPFAPTRWSDARSSGGAWEPPPTATFGHALVDAREIQVAVDPARAFGPISRIGGTRGWYCATWMWQLRGVLDLLLGGVGMRRGRRDPETPAVGDTIDFWRVEAYDAGRRLLLSAEMKMPGRAWLEFEVRPGAAGAGSIIRQTAVFHPLGLAGLLYWYALMPMHAVIFRGMLHAIARRAQQAPA